NLASIYSDLGDFQLAFENYQKVAELRKEVSGLKHPDYISSLFNLAISEFELGKNDISLSHFAQSLKLIQERSIDYFGQLTESQRENFWALNSYHFASYPLFLEKAS